jgi:hypothetical protein
MLVFRDYQHTMTFTRRTPSFGAASLNADQFLAIVRAGISAPQNEGELA